MTLSAPAQRLLASALLLAAGHAFAASEEVPFVTTPDNVTLEMLRIAKVGPRDHVIDLGSGDGRIVILAAKRFGATGLGVELVAQYVADSRESARRAGVGERARFQVQDLYATDLSPATVITMYLLPEVNLELRPRILDLEPGTRIVSHDWDMGDWKPDRTVVVDAPEKTIGLEKKSRVHFWVVPAKLEGAWCSGKRRVEITQSYQAARVDGRDAKITGNTLKVLGGKTYRLEGGRLRNLAAKTNYSRC